MAFLAGAKGYLIMGAGFIVVILLYGNSMKHVGREESAAEWMAKITSAPAETVLVHDTLRFSVQHMERVIPPTVRLTGFENDEGELEDEPCEFYTTLVDSFGGSHEIAYFNRRLTEMFSPAPYPYTEHEITRTLVRPMTPESRWVLGISAEAQKEIGVGLLIGRKPLFIMTRYYFESRTFGFGVGLLIEF